VPLVGLKGKAIKFILDTFTFIGIKFAYLIVNDVVYFRAKDVAEFLGYKNTNDAIKTHVPLRDQKTLQEIFKPSDLLGLEKIKGNTKNTIYITEAGLYRLIFASKKEGAADFQDFIFQDILPNIRKSGSYSLNDNPYPTLVLNTSTVQSFYETHNVTDYDEQNVVYLGVIGTCEGGYLVKYGRSSRVFKRDFEEHQVTFGKQFTMVFIMKTDNNIRSETQFGNLITTRKLNREMIFNGKERTELFVTNEFFTLNNAINAFTEIVTKNPTKKQIEELCSNNPVAKLDKRIILAKEATEREREITKREEEITKQKELELERLKIKLELAKIGKNEPIKETIEEPLKTENKCIYKMFLDECTKESNSNVHCSELYKTFKVWFKNNNPHAKIPSNKEFVLNLRKHKETCKVSVNNKSQLGVRNLQIL
jgi:prophage antirepressor-like protein